MGKETQSRDLMHRQPVDQCQCCFRASLFDCKCFPYKTIVPFIIDIVIVVRAQGQGRCERDNAHTPWSRAWRCACTSKHMQHHEPWLAMSSHGHTSWLKSE